MTVLLIILAIGFAYSMGAHYTGACMGMPCALRALSARTALLLMAPLTLIGATFASHRFEHTVGHSLLSGSGRSVDGLVIVIGVAFALTSLFNWRRIPTSTIQILVFSVVVLAAGAPPAARKVGAQGAPRSAVSFGPEDACPATTARSWRSRRSCCAGCAA